VLHIFGSSSVISVIGTMIQGFQIIRWFTGYRTAKAWFGGISERLVDVLICVPHYQVQHF